MNETWSNRQLYDMARDRMLSVVAPLDDETLAQTCAACPDWSIRDVVAHHIHFQGAYVRGEVPRYVLTALQGEGDEADEAAQQRDDWTQSGVEERRSRPFAEVLKEWDDVVAAMTEPTAVAIDATMHLYDIQETLDDDSGRQLPIVFDAFSRYHQLSLTPKLQRLEKSVGAIATDTGESNLPDDPEAPVVRGTGYDLLRTIGGRRTRAEADDALDWGKTPESVRSLWASYGWKQHETTT